MPNFLKKAIKFLIALSLLPTMPPLGRSLWIQISKVEERTLLFDNPLSLCLFGVIVWIVFDALFHVPPGIYVFAHELTHALFIKLFGGRIKRIAVHCNHGYVESDRSNFLIVLAPYLFPFYAFIVVGFSASLACFVPFPRFETAFWILLGIGLGYHWIMTAKMLGTRQTDFSSQGYFFSFVLILFTNGLMVWTIFLVLPKPTHVTVQISRLGRAILESYGAFWNAIWTWFKYPT